MIHRPEKLRISLNTCMMMRTLRSRPVIIFSNSQKLTRKAYRPPALEFGPKSFFSTNSPQRVYYMMLNQEPLSSAI